MNLSYHMLLADIPPHERRGKQHEMDLNKGYENIVKLKTGTLYNVSNTGLIFDL